MLPGKKLTPEDLVRIALRRKWLILVPFVLCSAGAVFVSKHLPNEYRSETLIMLMPQRVPDSYVKSTVTGKIEDRLATLNDQILSRSRLEPIITELNLYPELQRTSVMEDVVRRMRSDISVDIDGKESFRVSYISRDPELAQKVTARLASLFIEQNLRDRENMAEETNQFLEAQLEDARGRLEANEKKLEAYRKRYAGELPTQAASNLQAIQNAQNQLQAVAEASDRLSERRLLLERQLIDAQSPQLAVSLPAQAAGAPEAAAGQSTAQQLEAAKNSLQVLLTRDKPDHPDVKRLQRTIRDLEAKLIEEAKHPADAAPLSPQEALRQKRIRDLTAQISDIDRELEDKKQQSVQLRATIASYQAKLDAVPTRESELVELTRDYTTLQETYQSLLAKREESKMAANLERRNIGEQFRVLDPARVPVRPFRPNRLQIDAMGAAAGLLIGLALTALLEYRDATFKVEDDVVRVLALPVLAVIPVMTSETEAKQQRRRRLLVQAMAALLVVGSAAAVIIWRLQS